MEDAGCPLGIVGLPAHQRIAQSWNDYCCSRCFICTIIRERVLSGASSKWVAVLSGGKEGKRGTRQRWEEEIGRKWVHVFALTVQLVSGSSEGNRAPPSFILCILHHFFPPSLLFVCLLSCLSLSLLICSWEARSACQTTGCFSSLCGQTRSLRSHAWMHEVHNAWEEEIIYLPLRGAGVLVSLLFLIVVFNVSLQVWAAGCEDAVYRED